MSRDYESYYSPDKRARLNPACLLVYVVGPLVLFLLAWLSTGLWKFSEWWACLTVVLIATGISWSIFCWWIDTDTCVVRPEVCCV